MTMMLLLILLSAFDVQAAVVSIKDPSNDYQMTVNSDGSINTNGGGGGGNDSVGVNGATAPNYSTQVAGQYAGNLEPLNLDSNGNLLTTVTFPSFLPVTQESSPWVDNLTQFGGTDLSTGTGASGSGIPRVTVSNDSNILSTQSGTWTVQQGSTPTAVANAWPVKPTDGTTIITVKAASTPPLSTDTAEVVALSPNGNQATATYQAMQLGYETTTASNTTSILSNQTNGDQISQVTGIYNTTVPSFTNLQLGNLQIDSRGGLQTTPLDEIGRAHV